MFSTVVTISEVVVVTTVNPPSHLWDGATDWVTSVFSCWTCLLCKLRTLRYTVRTYSCSMLLLYKLVINILAPQIMFVDYCIKPLWQFFPGYSTLWVVLEASLKGNTKQQPTVLYSNHHLKLLTVHDKDLLWRKSPFNRFTSKILLVLRDIVP